MNSLGTFQVHRNPARAICGLGAVHLQMTGLGVGQAFRFPCTIDDLPVRAHTDYARTAEGGADHACPEPVEGSSARRWMPVPSHASSRTSQETPVIPEIVAQPLGDNGFRI